MSKYTPWFPGTVKPVLVGVYQRQYNTPPQTFYCHWDGKHWSFAENTAKEAARTIFGGKSPFQERPWRGLAEKPE